MNKIIDPIAIDEGNYVIGFTRKRTLTRDDLVFGISKVHGPLTPKDAKGRYAGRSVEKTLPWYVRPSIIEEIAGAFPAHALKSRDALNLAADWSEQPREFYQRRGERVNLRGLRGEDAQQRRIQGVWDNVNAFSEDDLQADALVRANDLLTKDLAKLAVQCAEHAKAVCRLSCFDDGGREGLDRLVGDDAVRLKDKAAALRKQADALREEERAVWAELADKRVAAVLQDVFSDGLDDAYALLLALSETVKPPTPQRGRII